MSRHPRNPTISIYIFILIRPEESGSCGQNHGIHHLFLGPLFTKFSIEFIHHANDLVRFKGLGHIVQGPLFHGIHRRIHLGIGRHHDHGDPGPNLFGPGQ